MPKFQKFAQNLVGIFFKKWLTGTKMARPDQPEPNLANRNQIWPTGTRFSQPEPNLVNRNQICQPEPDLANRNPIWLTGTKFANRNPIWPTGT